MPSPDKHLQARYVAFTNWGPNDTVPTRYALRSDTWVRTCKVQLAYDSPHAPRSGVRGQRTRKSAAGQSMSGREDGTLSLPQAPGLVGQGAGRMRIYHVQQVPRQPAGDVIRQNGECPTHVGAVSASPAWASRRAALHEAGIAPSVSTLVGSTSAQDSGLGRSSAALSAVTDNLGSADTSRQRV